MVAGTHGSTYGGNPLACAVGVAVMEEVADESFLAHVRAVSDHLRQGLESLVASHPEVFESVRGEGLMIGIKCKVTNMDMVQAGYDQQVLTVPGGDNVLRLLPPLTITKDEVTEAIRRLDAAASALEAGT